MSRIKNKKLEIDIYASLLTALTMILTISGHKAGGHFFSVIREIVKPIMLNSEEFVEEKAYRCFGQTFRLDNELRTIIKEQVDCIYANLSLKDIQKKCWILCEILEICGERITNKQWNTIDAFISFLSGQQEQDFSSLYVEIVFRRFFGLALCQNSNRLGNAIAILKTKKHIFSVELGFNLCRILETFIEKSSKDIEKFKLDLCEVLICMVRQHDEELRFLLIIIIQKLLSLKENISKIEKIGKYFEKTDEELLLKICKTVRY